MFRTARRSIGRLELLLLLAPSIAGCMSTQRIPYSNIAGLNRVTGVTTLSGSEIPFAKRGASVANDTLYAVGRRGQLTLPSDSIAQVWTRKFSLVRTLEIVGGFLVAAAIERGALGNTQLFPDDY